jgi:hypothetical protein
MPKEILLNSEEMARYYRKSTLKAFLQAWRRDKKRQQRLIPDPINEGAPRGLLWRASDVDRCIAEAAKITRRR